MRQAAEILAETIDRYHADHDAPFKEAVTRFCEADPRWQSVLSVAAMRLSDPARQALGIALALLTPGPAPKLLSYELEPDDQERILREAAHMRPEILTLIGVHTPMHLGPGHPEIAAVQGMFTAIHRLIRAPGPSKTRPR
ncbi:MAG TPA: hypothetical protein VL283_00430 [Candidatus Baltobacteraceae bacterium]|nr:hypothetical protein [Candidatus Baltobacteraceae bacterium]